ncbi:MAG TPA: 2-dehydropantoate 2-reductase, partial [Ramlibacter sp.]
MQLKKVCIYGAGAIGGWMGAKLARAGCDVGVVARGATLAALKQRGLELRSGSETIAAPVRASAAPADFGAQDLVVIAVKSQAMAEVAMCIGPLLGPDTVVLSAMNGVPWWFLDGFGGAHAGTRLKAVDPEGAIARAIPAKHIIGCVVHASCAVAAPGVVQHHFGNRLIVGEPSGEKTARVRALVDLLVHAGFETELADQIQKDAWYKLWGNMTVNPISAMTGATTDKILDDELVRDFISRVMLEAREIGAR